MRAIGRKIGEERGRLTTLDGDFGLMPDKNVGIRAEAPGPTRAFTTGPQPFQRASTARDSSHVGASSIIDARRFSRALVADRPHHQAFAARETIAAGGKFEAWRTSVSSRQLARVEHCRKKRS